MLPSIFGEDLFDDFFNDPFGMMNVSEGRSPLYGKHAKNLMKTDIREKEDGYELAVDLPGFKKDEISIDLSNGYLTIQAAKGLDKDEEDKKGRYIRRERYAGSMSRSFGIYVLHNPLLVLLAWAMDKLLHFPVWSMYLLLPVLLALLLPPLIALIKRIPVLRTLVLGEK